MSDSDINQAKGGHSSSAFARPSAGRLVSLSLDPATGAVSRERVRAIVETLVQTRPPAVLRPLLKAYHAALRREIARGEVRIEHAGALSPDAVAGIVEYLGKKNSRVLTPVLSPNPDLIAGLRVRVGDDVFEASARAALDKLAAALAH
jgi:F-type H+-transporting ATPase subunit delta